MFDVTIAHGYIDDVLGLTHAAVLMRRGLVLLMGVLGRRRR